MASRPRRLAERAVRWSRGDAARLAVAALVAASLAILLVLRQEERLLHAMHVPAAHGYGVRDLADLGLHWPSSSQPELVLDTWSEFRAHTHVGPSPVALAHDEVWFDLLFIALYAPAFALLLVRGRRRLATMTYGDARRTYRALALYGLAALPVLALADLSEDLAQLTAMADCGNGCSAGTFWWLWVSAVVKTAAAAAVVLPLLFVGLAGQGRGVRGTLLALRIPIAMVVVLGLLLFGPLGQDQFADVIRRWANLDVSDAFFASALMLWLGMLVLVVGR